MINAVVPGLTNKGYDMALILIGMVEIMPRRKTLYVRPILAIRSYCLRTSFLLSYSTVDCGFVW